MTEGAVKMTEGAAKIFSGGGGSGNLAREVAWQQPQPQPQPQPPQPTPAPALRLQSSGGSAGSVPGSSPPVSPRGQVLGAHPSAAQLAQSVHGGRVSINDGRTIEFRSSKHLLGKGARVPSHTRAHATPSAPFSPHPSTLPHPSTPSPPSLTRTPRRNRGTPRPEVGVQPAPGGPLDGGGAAEGEEEVQG